MDTFEAIHQRRSIKHFDPNHRLTEDEIRLLVEAAIESPTSFNMQHWRFVVVTDEALRKELRAAAFDQAQVTDASLVILVTTDLMAWNKEPERYWRSAPDEVSRAMVGMIRSFYEGSEQLQRDEAIRSVGIASQTIMLAAKAMGYDSSPMIGFDSATVAKLIRLPQDHIIGLMICVGKAAKPARPRSGQLPLDEVVIREKFPDAE